MLTSNGFRLPSKSRWRRANCMTLPLAKKLKLLAKDRLVETAFQGDQPGHGPPAAHLILAETTVKRLMMLALAEYAMIEFPCAAQTASPVAMTCDAGPAAARAEPANLHGHWDFLMVPRGVASFGLMSIGFVGTEYGGSLAPVRTAPVVLRDISVNGDAIHMTVASLEGDVLFDGRLSAKGDFMCGSVTYHGGETFPMIAHKRPMTYQSPSTAERAPQPND